MKKLWHQFNIRYYEILFKDCLHDKMKCEFQRKISYHKLKLGELNYACKQTS
ncbi:hypothetical protein [Peribacillus butanolivorans]|uniref:hypothetical protein n=1 Tax=Peribacillus butanolivorans TaxID=421767 RepID=UPI003D2C151C